MQATSFQLPATSQSGLASIEDLDLSPKAWHRVTVPDYRQLKVWQRAHQIVLEVYKLTRQFPSDERFTLTSQMRRAALSVPMNIAEGAGRGSDPDYQRFLGYAIGSLNELEYQLTVSRDLGLGSISTYPELARELAEVRAMLSALRTRVRGDRAGRTPPS